MIAPDWLQRHDGRLRENVDQSSWSVLFAGLPQYAVEPIPAEGAFGCQVVQTINGKRIECAGKFPTADAALQAGLEALRLALGW